MGGLEDDFVREWFTAASSSGDSGDDAGHDAGESMGEGSQLLPAVTRVFHREMEDAKQRRSAAVHVAAVANRAAVNRQRHVAATSVGTCDVELPPVEALGAVILLGASGDIGGGWRRRAGGVGFGKGSSSRACIGRSTGDGVGVDVVHAGTAGAAGGGTPGRSDEDGGCDEGSSKNSWCSDEGGTCDGGRHSRRGSSSSEEDGVFGNTSGSDSSWRLDHGRKGGGSSGRGSGSFYRDHGGRRSRRRISSVRGRSKAVQRASAGQKDAAGGAAAGHGSVLRGRRLDGGSSRKVLRSGDVSGGTGYLPATAARGRVWAAAHAAAPPFVPLCACTPPPTMTAYGPLRRCLRRVERHKDVRFVPYLGESAVPRALLRSIVLKNGWQLVDSDGSDASESDDDNRPKDYYSMGPRTRRAAERRAVVAVIKDFGSGPSVVQALAMNMQRSDAAVRRLLGIVQRRMRDMDAAPRGCRAAAALSATLEELTGGQRLAKIMVGGDVGEAARSPPAGWQEVWDGLAVPAAAYPACLEAGRDVAAAGLPARSRAWLVAENVSAAAELAPAASRIGDLAAVREYLQSACDPAEDERMSRVGSNSASRSSPSGVSATSSGGGAAAHAVTPTSADGAVVPECSILGRDTFSRLLCRLCLRYACRAQGARHGMELLAPPLTAPRHLPVDHDRMRTHMAAGGNLLAPDVLGPARRLFIPGAGPAAAAAAAALDEDMSSGSSAAAVRNRCACVQHKALSVSGGSCVDCRHDVRAHPSIFQCGLGAPAESRWTAEQVSLLHAAAEQICRLDTCLLACFVPGRTCRGVALHLDSFGWPPAAAPAERAVEEEAEGVQASRCALAPAAESGTSAHVGDVLSHGDAVMSSLEDAAAPEKVADYQPCTHSGSCHDDRCSCVRNAFPCEKYCGCSGTRWISGEARGPRGATLALSGAAGGSETAAGSSLCRRRTWCTCRPPASCSTDDCPFFRVDRECDPDACLSCGAHWHPLSGLDGTILQNGRRGGGGTGRGLQGAATVEPAPRDSVGLVEAGMSGGGTSGGTRRCRNVQLQVGPRPRLPLGLSAAHGLGLFASEEVAEGAFVGEYTGEVLSLTEARIRGRKYDAADVSFPFRTTKTVVRDAMCCGNRTMFINHSAASPNLEVKLLSVCGDIPVAFLATSALRPGEEQFFHYGYTVSGWRA